MSEFKKLVEETLLESKDFDHSFHAKKAAFHKEAAQFFRAGKMEDRANFHDEMASVHNNLVINDVQ